MLEELKVGLRVQLSSEHWPTMCEHLGLMLNTIKKKEREDKKKLRTLTANRK
jgi:hypothetical protein